MAEKTPEPGAKAAAKAPPCPICDKPAAEKYRPFCSKRCADVDLHRWLGGNYRLPTEEPGFVDEDGQGAEVAEFPRKYD